MWWPGSVGSILLQAWVTHIAQGGATGPPAGAVGLLRGGSVPPSQCLTARPGVPGESIQGAVSKRGAPTCQGLGLHGHGDIIHTWSCCVSGPQTDPTADPTDQGCPSYPTQLPGAAGFWRLVGSRREDGGAGRRCWELLLRPVVSLLSHSSSDPQALLGLQCTEPAHFPSPALPFFPQHQLLCRGAGVGSQPTTGTVWLPQVRLEDPLVAPPAPPLTPRAVAECDKRSPMCHCSPSPQGT